MQRSTPTLTDQNHSKHLFFTDTESLLFSSPCKGRPTRYRPKPSCSNRCAQQLSQCPCKSRPLDVPIKTMKTILFSQIHRTSSPIAHAKTDPYIYRSKPVLTILFSHLAPARFSSSHVKADPYMYRPKPFQLFWSHRYMPQREYTFSTQPVPSVKTYTLNFDPCSNPNDAETFFYLMLRPTTACTDSSREESKGNRNTQYAWKLCKT